MSNRKSSNSTSKNQLPKIIVTSPEGRPIEQITEYSGEPTTVEKLESIFKRMTTIGQARPPNGELASLIQENKLKDAEKLVKQRTRPQKSPTSWEFLDLRGGENSGVAFVFDLDGVLLKDQDEGLTGAAKTIKFLQKRKIPFIFLTNRGGADEAYVKQCLTYGLKTKIDERQVVQSHTPFKDLLDRFGKKNVLHIGGRAEPVVRRLARKYGFKNIFTAADIYAIYEHKYPNGDRTNADNTLVKAYRDKWLVIDAIFVWSAHRSAIAHVPLIVDLLVSDRGDLFKTPSQYSKDTQPPLYICRPDFVSPTRLAGDRTLLEKSFCSSLQRRWDKKTGGSTQFHFTAYGKPYKDCFTYAEKILHNWNKTLVAEKVFHDLHDPPSNSSSRAPEQPRQIKTVYMVGDTVNEDIKGSMLYRSQYGYRWKSVLVETGVYQPGQVPDVWPTNIEYGVMDAVEWALQNESWTPFKPKNEKENREEMRRKKEQGEASDPSQRVMSAEFARKNGWF